MRSLKGSWLKLFLLMSLGGAVIVVSLAFYTWEQIYTKSKLKQEHLVRLVSDALDAQLKSNEILLNMLGDELIKHYVPGQKLTVPAIFNKILTFNESIGALGLTTPSGEYIHVSGNLHIDSLPNLKEQPESRDSFIHALNSPDKMVLGRTYLFKPYGAWLIPLRKAVRDINGKIIAVSIAALTLKDAADLFNNNLHEGEHNKVSILRSFDLYEQYVSGDNIHFESMYKLPLEKSVFERAVANINSKYDFEEVKKSERIITLLTAVEKRDRGIISLRYNNRYELWTISEEPLSVLVKELTGKVTAYAALYLLSLVSLYILFLTIQRKEHKRLEDLYYFVNHDPLTGLYNFKYLVDNIDAWYAKKNGFSVLYVDMDHFKGLNDTYGHSVGDMVLKEICSRLKAFISEKDFLVRKGGDEFVVLTEIIEDQALLEKARALISRLSDLYFIDSYEFQLSASVGISKYPHHSKDINELILTADIALSEAKREKSSAVIYSELYEENYIARSKLERRLKDAIKGGEIYMVYQPQFNEKREIVGLEALVRWADKEFGMVNPELLISIAEASGEMVRLGGFILETALRETQHVFMTVGESFRLSVNISVIQFVSRDFLESVNSTIALTEFDRRLLTLEVTESLFIENKEKVYRLLKKLQQDSVQVSLDDFGTGYSSLSLLKTIPIDELKIDKSFVEDILSDKNSRRMIENIIDIGKNMDLSVVAEGVENEEQFEMLKNFGCDRFQGYYFSKPIKQEELINFIKEWCRG